MPAAGPVPASQWGAPHFRDPVLPGFHPDPSVCRVGEDYWLVCSSFSYFPGLPVFHSRDLVNWRQAGNVLDRPEQLQLTGLGHSQGLFAPTLRWHGGRFFLVCTLVAEGRSTGPLGNFVVTATDPAGPWSDPVWLPDAPGIDPSLFFDSDGRCWYCGTRERRDAAFFGDWEIWVRELDPADWRFRGEAQGIWRGALRDCIWPEGPHLYKRGEWYYLLHAEGGTDVHHAISIARSRSITGPWTGNPGNPILTHRHFGRDCALTKVGHGDLVETPDGDWWMILLASRPRDGVCNLGRETFVVDVAWEDDWPVVAPGRGCLDSRGPLPRLAPAPVAPACACEHFDSPGLPPHWLQLRTPAADGYSLDFRPGWLALGLRPVAMNEGGQPAMVVRRQLHHDWLAMTKLDFRAVDGDEAAGLVLMQNDAWQYRLERGQGGGGQELRVVMVQRGVSRVVERHALPAAADSVLVLAAWEAGHVLRFGWGPDSRSISWLPGRHDSRVLSTELAGGFVGTVIGLFASACPDREPAGPSGEAVGIATAAMAMGGPAGRNRPAGAAERQACFAWFEYRGLIG
jgi:alpha-N-arabinofuranosidase